PKDTTEIFVSTWKETSNWNGQTTSIGLLRFKNGILQDNYTEQNSIPVGFWRIGGSTFDEEGNLWVGQSYVQSPINTGTRLAKRDTSGNWSSIVVTPQADAGARKPVVYNGYAFFPLPRQEQGMKMTNMQDVYTISSVA